MAMISQHYKVRAHCNALNNFSHQAGLLMEQLAARSLAGSDAGPPDFSSAKQCLSDHDLSQDEPGRLVLPEAEKIIFELEALFKLEASLHPDEK